MNYRGIALAIALGISAPASGLAQEREPVGVSASDSGVVFDFQDADLRVVVSALAEVAGLNIIYTDLPPTPVTLRTTRPVPVDEVRELLESLAEANDLQLIEDRGLIRLVSLAQATDVGSPDLGPQQGVATPSTRIWIHRLLYARAEVIVATLRALYGLGGESALYEAQAMPRTLSERLEDQLDAPFRDLERLVEQQRPQQPPPQQQQPLQEEPADSEQSETAWFASGLQATVEIVPDLVNNAVLIRATAADYGTLRAAIQELDQRPLQVMIEVLIAEVRRSNDFALGIDASISDADGSPFASLTGRSAGDFVMGIMEFGGVNVEVVVQALAASGDVTILSRPIIFAQNNREARILIGDQRPFIQVVRTLPTDAAVRDQVVQYRNVGTQLAIRPTINADGYLNLLVTQEVSTATSEVQFGAPVINTRELQTELLVKDGHTVVLGGLIDRQSQETRSGVPILMDIPIIGMLFRSTQTKEVANELFILLTPHVMRTDEDVDEMTDRLHRGSSELKDRLKRRSIFSAPVDSVQHEP